MGDSVAAELLKLRSLRSSWVVLAASVLAIAAGGVLAVLITADFDGSSLERRATFDSADMSVVIIPLLALVTASVAAAVFTGEYGSGLIRTTLTGVPSRRKLFAAKTLVVGLVAFALGQVVSFALFGLTLAAVGDRPAPIAPWTSAAAGVPSAVASGSIIAVVCLLALGLGAVVRSTAGTLVTVAVLLYVVPGLAAFLPAAVSDWVFALWLLNLAPQMVGGDGSLLSPVGAVAVAVGYAVVPLGCGWFLFSRRDA
ncbi:ABC transporter permease [Actinokineospora sp. NBRC 105648]|nr:ABC transporter permease [Actinokineospora sp. NBRC 105648]